MRVWSTEDAAELYNIRGWGIGYFDINEKGNVVVKPRKDQGPAIDLMEVLEDLSDRDVSLPVLLRFSDIIADRMTKICRCFEEAAREFGYQGKYFGVYPIKVNQQRYVVEEIARVGAQFNMGLEAGSKPELQAVLPILDNPESLIICNGYKDEEFIELALLAQKMGKQVFLVVEKLNELKEINAISRRINVRPNIGVRIKLTNTGSGKWEESGGDTSKFGLTASELLEAIDYARENGLLDCTRMIHFHLGSQITNIRRIKAGLREVAQFYVQMRMLGCAVEFVDFGGGLGVDYDGSRSLAASSVNYSIEEYANDAVYAMSEVCGKANLPHPHLVTESGRALTAHHSVLVFNVLETASLPSWNEKKNHVTKQDHEITQEMHSLYKNLTTRNMMESWHDALMAKEEALKLFSLGLLDLATRAKMERLFWEIARQVRKLSAKLKAVPEEIADLPRMLADKYFCNVSIFQSLPDSWAIDQVFPIMPIHRLHEKPGSEGTLQDITCDSDGKIDRFVTTAEFREFLPLHEFKSGKPYYIAAFLVGAYQEILGDLHNLFGDTNAVHIVVNEKGGYDIAQVVNGETAEEVLEYVEFNPKELVRTLEKWVSTAVKKGKVTALQGKEFLAMYANGLYGYTYLEE